METIVVGALFLDQEFRFIGSVEQEGKRIVELAFQEEERGKDLFLSPGGSAANTAIQAARLGSRVAVVGKVGEDPFGELIRSGLDREGVDTGWLRQAAEVGTGVTVVLSARKGRDLELAMITHNGANEVLELRDLPPPGRPGHDARDAAHGAGGAPASGVFFLGDFFAVPRLQPDVGEILKEAGRRGWITALDHGRFRRAKTPERAFRCLQTALEVVHVYLPSEKEIREVAGKEDLSEALDEVQERYGVPCIVVKRGALGCRLRTPDLDLEAPGFPLREGGVSAVGAGSAFNAAFLMLYAQDRDALERAARFANAAGRIKVFSGEPPTLERLMRFVESRP